MSKQKHTGSLDLIDVKRRRLLLGLGSIVGAATAGQLLDGNAFSVAMAYTESTDTAKRSTKVFDASQLATLRHI
jgi:chitinase